MHTCFTVSIQSYCLTGASRMAAIVKAIKANATNDVIVLDAGDQFTGTGALHVLDSCISQTALVVDSFLCNVACNVACEPSAASRSVRFIVQVWNVVYKGNEAPPFQKLMGVQAMTVGNHEWCVAPEICSSLGRVHSHLNLQKSASLGRPPPDLRSASLQRPCQASRTKCRWSALPQGLRTLAAGKLLAEPHQELPHPGLQRRHQQGGGPDQCDQALHHHHHTFWCQGMRVPAPLPQKHNGASAVSCCDASAAHDAFTAWWQSRPVRFTVSRAL